MIKNCKEQFLVLNVDSLAGGHIRRGHIYQKFTFNAVVVAQVVEQWHSVWAGQV